MNLKKCISIIVLIVIFLCKQGGCKDIVIGTLLPKQKRFEFIIKGIKTHLSEIKIVNLLESKKVKPNLIIAYEKFLHQAIKFQKPTLVLADNEHIVDIYKKYPTVKTAILLSAPLEKCMTLLKKKFKNIKTFSVVVGDKLEYNYLKVKHIKGLKIFFAKNMGDVPYKIDKALKAADALIAVPSPVVFNYFSTQFILKKAILEGKPVIGFSEDMLNLGAYAVVITDYFSEGCRVCSYIKKILEHKKLAFRILKAQNIKVITNHNLH